MRVNLKIDFNNKLITNSTHKNFLWMAMNNTLSWNKPYRLNCKEVAKFQNMHVCFITENDLLCLFSLSYELWNYILGKFVA